MILTQPQACLTGLLGNDLAWPSSFTGEEAAHVVISQDNKLMSHQKQEGSWYNCIALYLSYFFALPLWSFIFPLIAKNCIHSVCEENE